MLDEMLDERGTDVLDDVLAEPALSTTLQRAIRGQPTRTNR
jgi:hypothetical protein